MRLVPLSEAAGYDFKEKIPATRGKISKINDYASGVTNGQNWSIQTVELCDPKDPKFRVRVKLWNGEEVPKAWMHKVVHLECVEGERGPKGVTMEQDVYKWKEGQPIKKQIEVQCGDGAIFALAGDTKTENAPAPARQQAAQGTQATGGGKTAENAPARPTGNQAAQTAPAATQTKRHSSEAPMSEDEKREVTAKAAKFAARKVSGFRVVLRAMDQLAEERQKLGKPLTPEQFQGMTTSIFIAGDRAFIWEQLPMSEELLEKYWPKPKQSATTEPAAQ